MTDPALEIPKSEIEAAAQRIAPYVRRTPVLRLPAGFGPIRAPVTLKLEWLQVTGSFKARGAFNLLLGRDVPAAGVVAASGGNFGLAIAHAARALGIPATVFIPATSPASKIELLRRLGARVETTAGFYPAALEAATTFAATGAALAAHAYDQPEIVAGQGTCGREIAEQAPGIDTLLVAVGGGGLIAGIGSWLRDTVRLVAVETDATPTLHAARAAGRPVDVEVGGLAASALGAGRIGRFAWEASGRWIDESLLVTDAELVAAQRLLWDELRIAVEPAAAAPVAALAFGRYVPAAEETVGVVLCGANLDPATLSLP